MSYEEDIQRDIDALDGLSNDNMVIRKKIITKLESAIDSIDFASANCMKPSHLLAVTGLVTALNGTLNDTEDSRLKVLKSKQKKEDSNNENENASKLITQFLQGVSSGSITKPPADNTSYQDESLLDQEIKNRNIEANPDELSYGGELDGKISGLIEEIS